MILEFLLLIVISSLASIGFYAACGFDGDEAFDQSDNFMRANWPKPTDDQKMIFWWVRYYLGPHLGKYWYKPVYGCLPCMGSLHSIYPTLIYLGFSYEFLIIWPLIALGTCGINKVITQVW